MNPEKVRLQKFLSECGVASRRAAEKLISSGQVVVNGQIVTAMGTKIDPDSDRIVVSGRRVQAVHKGVLLLNKPEGVISTMSDPQGRKTVAHYLTKKYKSYFPVGRLDYESSGLLIFTNDGDLGERLLHPRYGLKRTYQVLVEGRVSNQILARIESGVTLDDGPVRARVTVLKDQRTQTDQTTHLELVITEGRNRIIRRLMDKLGHPVKKLLRVAHGPFRLGTLRPGEVRKLSEKQYQSIRRKLVGLEE